MKLLGIALLLWMPVLSSAKDDLNHDNYPLTAHVQETGMDNAGSHSRAPGSSVPLSVGGQPTLQVDRSFMSVAILKMSDGKSYHIHGEQVQFLRLDHDYSCRIAGKKDSRLEILGQDGKGHWHQWKATIDRVQ